MSAGTIITHMNKKGHPDTLVPAQPGNKNALKYGVYSPRVIEPRAAEIAAELTRSFQFSIAQRIAVGQVARCIAILEALDRDLDERGLADKHGEPRSLLNHRSRVSRQLDQWLSKIAPSIERQTADKQAPLSPGRADYVAELQRIALGQDTTASARDRVSALQELLQVDAASKKFSVTHLHVTLGQDKIGGTEVLPETTNGDETRPDESHV
jgi:hypothetical protein